MRHRGPIAPSIQKTHPLTGEVLEPVGIVNGRYVWPICGGAEEDDDDDDDDDDGDSGADDKGKDKDDKSKDPDSGGDSKDDGKEDSEVLRRRMKAADKRADEAEARLKKIEDAKKDDLTKATERAEELEKEIESRDEVIRELRLKNAFLSTNKHNWHDPDTALDLAERNGYLEEVLSDDGEVDKVRLGKALDRLAKEKQFLVKTEEKKNDEPGEPSGEPAGGRSDNTKDDKAKKEALRKRFPVLNR